MVAGLCCCPKQNWSTLPGSWTSFAPKPVSEKLTRGDPSPCSRVVGFGAQFQAVHVEDGWQDGGRSHTSMGGMVSCSHSITAAPSPSSCCLSPFARFFIIFDHIRGEKKAERLRHRGAAGRSCIARTARLSSGSAPCFFFFYPASGFGCLNCSCLVLMQRNLLGAFAFLHGWVAVPGGCAKIACSA